MYARISLISATIRIAIHIYWAFTNFQKSEYTFYVGLFLGVSQNTLKVNTKIVLIGQLRIWAWRDEEVYLKSQGK
jgi:hypothetical protein